MSLRVVTLLAATASTVAAIVAVDRGLPAEFAGVLDGDSTNVLGEFLLWRGTAISPPLPLIVALVALAFVVPQNRLATRLLAAIGAGGVLAYLGEPQTWDAHPLYTPLVVVSVALFGAAAVLGVRASADVASLRTVSA